MVENKKLIIELMILYVKEREKLSEDEKRIILNTLMIAQGKK